MSGLAKWQEVRRTIEELKEIRSDALYIGLDVMGTPVLITGEGEEMEYQEFEGRTSALLEKLFDLID